jgi:integrase
MTLFASVNSIFQEIRAISDLVEHDQAAAIAENWRRRTLNEDFERRIAGEELLNRRESASQIAERLRQMDFREDSDLIDSVSQESGLQLDSNSQDWRRLAFYLIRARHDAAKEIQKRDESGNQSLSFYPIESENAHSTAKSLSLSSMLKRWENDQPRNHRSIIDWRIAIQRFIELKGDKDVRKITKADVRDFRDLCVELPAKLPKADRQLEAPDLIRKYKDREVDRLSARTANKYIASLRSVLSLAIRDGYLETNPTQGIQVALPKTTANRRLPFEKGDLEQIFALSPVFRFGERPSKGGSGEAAFWIPLIALYSGARLEELAQLRVTDIREENGFPYIDLNEEDGKSLKTASSARRIPIHRTVLETGFLDEVARLRRNGEKYVFPEMQHHLPKCSGAFSKWVNRYITYQCGITDSRKVFHSFRHTFKDACRRAGVPRDVHDALTGHSDGAVSSRYGLGFPMETLHEWINRIEYDGVPTPPRPAILGGPKDYLEILESRKESANCWKDAG